MSLNSTPLSERIYIGFFGNRNVGKSSLINAVTNQQLSIVSEVKGTTTDPVSKAMELLPLGPVNIIDTAGLDDEGELGKLRIDKTKQILSKVDIAILVVDAKVGLTQNDKHLIENFKDKKIKYIIAYNKCDCLTELPKTKENEIYVSSKKNTNINDLKELISHIKDFNLNSNKLVKDLIKPYSKVVLVTPIDESAPKGRIILPQQQVIRDLLDACAVITVVKDSEYKHAIDSFKEKPDLVITDSQVFGKISQETPNDVLLTSFSILMARYKGVLDYSVKSVSKIETLNDNDIILISEGCTHHRQCNDIGTVKIPKWLKECTNKQLNFEFTSGNTFPRDLSKYKMVIQCGGCMLKDKEVLERYKLAMEQNIPIVNYGITIAYLHHILKRSVQIFPSLFNSLR